ncbi:FadR/GntR family transcriptional regulator [Actinacidiphila acididurans]|uniref:FadR/GntR family transcriptional regulator n=1 Tax=Actinacidiphila acididurans TaxID=2784346 RepID=UPI0027DDDD43|nr:FadR/GntR family transcriptional regulator [Actinacidiphila acididurans]
MPAQRKPLAPVSPTPGRAARPTVQDRIVDLVIGTDLGPGDPLPAEPELMRALGVSRNSVREALKGLQALGIVDIRHGYGTYVGTAALRSMAPGLLFHSRLAVRRSNPQALRDIVEMRALMESGLIRRAAVELGPEDIARLHTELDALEADGDSGRAGHDRRFHELLYEPLGNALALQLIALFWDVYRTTEADMAKPRTDHAQVVRQHRQVLAALESHDPDAAAARIAEHFADVTARIDLWAGRSGTGQG